MHRLIINADDLGTNPQRSHGIFQCIEFGVVTSATIIPNGSDADNAAKRARERSIPAGLHLNLTEEYALSKRDDVLTLVEQDGQFLGRHKLHAALHEGKVERSALEREIRAQVDWFYDTYGPPTHIDSHHHIHTHPTVADVLIGVMERYGIRFVRIPCEEPLPPFGYEITPEQLEKTNTINAQARTARAIYAANGIESTEHFRGLTLVGNASLKNLRHILSKFPEGTTEIMVHPGSASSFGTSFDLDPQRQTELRMLMDPSIAEMISEKRIELCSFADL